MDKLRQTLNNCKHHVAKTGIRAEICKPKVFKITSYSSIFHFLAIKTKANNPSKQNEVKFCPLSKASGKFDLPHMISLKFEDFTHIKPSLSTNQYSL